MLTLEQVKTVNDGLRAADLNAALRPLEEAVDLRANELPKLDKKAREALIDGVKNRGDATIWADAILHPNVSVRRFARKVFMGLGDDAAPLFAPLRARVEAFWADEKPLPYSEKAREAALRREQSETIGGALELLLRADAAAFMAFYAERADAAPAPQPDDDGWNTPQRLAWQERNQRAYQATAQEIERLLQAEWGEAFVRGEKRGQLPMRVELELDERARKQPEIAALWADVGELAPGEAWQEIEPQWEPVGALMETWGGYLQDYKPSGPTRRVAQRVRPILWRWVEAALDESRPWAERERMARRLKPHGGYWGGGAISREQAREQLPALLARVKPPLLPALNAYISSCDERSRNEIWTGEAAIAKFWMDLLQTLGSAIDPRYDDADQPAATPALDAAMLRSLVADFPDDLAETNHLNWTLGQFHRSIEALEDAGKAAPGIVEVDEPFSSDDELRLHARFTLNHAEALSPSQLLELSTRFDQFQMGGFDQEKYDELQRELARQVVVVEAEISALGDDERLRRLIEAPHPRDERLTIRRQNYLLLWARDLSFEDAAAMWQSWLERAQLPLWARFEARLEAYRRMELEPIEPDIEQKLTAREAKEWRRDERARRRENIEGDVLDIAQTLISQGGLAARLRAIELADRPSCRDIRDQLEDGLAAELDNYPGGHIYQLMPVGFEGSSGWMSQVFDDGKAVQQAWQSWTLGAEWDEILEKIEARASGLKSDDWQRTNLERQLATGFYRRGNFAKFERYATRPGAFPQAVALAASELDDFEAWRVLLGALNEWNKGPLEQFWQAQQSDASKRARAVALVAQTLAQTNVEAVARVLLNWIKPLEIAEFEPHLPEIENALESALVPVKKWALSVLAKLDGFDHERAAQSASEMLWSENLGLAKDAAKFLSTLATRDENIVETAWESLGDATSLENIGVCEAVYRALVKIKSKHKSLEVSEAAREKLELLASVQSERFGKFEPKLIEAAQKSAPTSNS